MSMEAEDGSSDHPTAPSPPGTISYFASGSMMNPVSVKARGLHPISSQPAEVFDFDLMFFGSNGFATAIPSPGKSFHGVLHTLSGKDMKTLDSIEMGYERKTAKARTYDNEMVSVCIYVIGEDRGVDLKTQGGIPTERYLDVMIRGAEHYGVDRRHIDFLKQHDKVPRPSPANYLSFGGIPEEFSDTYLTMDDVARFDGLDGRPFYVAMGSKVVHLDLVSAKALNQICGLFRKMGQICDIAMAKVQYDPKFGIPEKLQDVTVEHSAYLEHNMCSYLEARGLLTSCKVVGHFQAPDDVS